MRSIVNCTHIETSAKIYREEQGKEICFEHSEYTVVCDIVGVDSCVFRNVHGQQSCDYLFLFDKKKQEYGFLKNKQSLAFYVELKGNELVTACKQLLNSIEKTMDQINNFEINALVVSSRAFVPKYDNNEFYRDLRRLIKRNIEFTLTPHTINLDVLK